MNLTIIMLVMTLIRYSDSEQSVDDCFSQSDGECDTTGLNLYSTHSSFKSVKCPQTCLDHNTGGVSTKDNGLMYCQSAQYSNKMCKLYGRQPTPKRNIQDLIAITKPKRQAGYNSFGPRINDNNNQGVGQFGGLSSNNFPFNNQPFQDGRHFGPRTFNGILPNADSGKPVCYQLKPGCPGYIDPNAKSTPVGGIPIKCYKYDDSDKSTLVTGPYVVGIFENRTKVGTEIVNPFSDSGPESCATVCNNFEKPPGVKSCKAFTYLAAGGTDPAGCLVFSTGCIYEGVDVCKHNVPEKGLSYYEKNC